MIDSKMPSGLKKYTEANRNAWNEVMPKHQKVEKKKWDDAFMKPGYVCLSEKEIYLLNQIGFKGKSVAHLCCNNGIELLSMKNLGANVCVGFDISDLAIQEAQERAELCQIDCQYVQSDVYEIGPEYENKFDIIYFSSGGLGWMPNIKLLFAIVTKMLRENGMIFIHEIHPFSEMLPFDNAEDNDVLRIVEPYFKTEPYVEYGDLDYVGGTKYSSEKPQYWFIHKLSDIQMALIENRMSIEYFAEYETDISAGHKRIEQAEAGIPLSYILIGKKHMPATPLAIDRGFASKVFPDSHVSGRTDPIRYAPRANVVALDCSLVSGGAEKAKVGYNEIVESWKLRALNAPVGRANSL